MIVKPRGVKGYLCHIHWQDDDLSDSVMYLENKDHLLQVIAVISVNQRVRRKIASKNGVSYYYFL